MKKFWKSLALLLCLLAGFGFVFTGCGSDDDDDGPELQISASAEKVEVGSTVTLTATYNGNDVTTETTFASGDENKATVTGATVKGIDSGTVEITGTCAGKTARKTLVVEPKTASAETVAGTYTFGNKTIVIAADGTVTITDANGNPVTGSVEVDGTTGAITIKNADGTTVYTATSKSDGSIDTDAVKDAEGNSVVAKELEKSFDGSLFLKLSSAPAYTANSKVYVLQGDLVVDTISLNDKYYTINNSKGAIAEINVKDQLVNFDDEGNVVILTHTDAEGYSQLYADTEYTVKVDDEVIGTYTTKKNPEISDNTISVGTNGDFTTIQGALNYLRKNELAGDWTINVAKGKYHERLAYYGSANVTIVGAADDNYGSKTVVDWKNMEGWNSGTTVRVNFIWQGGNLTLKNITLKSTYSRKADGTSDARNEVLNFQSKGYLVAYNSSFIGTQDTLIMGNSGGRAWFYKDYIAGDVDFIWGTLDVALFEECKILMRGDDTTSAYIFASRTVDTNKVNKGFVLYNSEVTVEDGVKAKAYYGRNSGSDTQAAVINCTFSQMLNSNLWASEATKNRNDAAGDAAIAYKDYGNKLADGTEISTAGRLALTYTMSERVVNREYNGRYAILNRGFDVEKNAYAFAETIWDISDYEAEFNASADTSKANVYVEPDYSKNIIGGNTVQLSGSSMADGVTYTYESSDTNLATVDANGLVTTVAGADGLVKITLKGSNDKTDYAQIKVIPTDIQAESLSLTAEKATMARYGLQTLTIGFTPADTIDREVEFTSSDENLKFYDASTKTLVEKLTTTDSKVQVWAGAEIAGATVTVKSVKYTSATPGTTTISTTGKDVVWHSDAAAIRMATDIQSGSVGLWDGLVVNSKADGSIITTNGKMSFKSAGSMQTRNVFLYIPVDGACTITIGHKAAISSAQKYTIGDGSKEFATEDLTTFTYDYDGTDTTGIVLGSTLSTMTFAKQAGADIVADAKYLKVNAVGSDRYITAISIGEYGKKAEEPANPTAATLTVPWTVNITDSETKKYGEAAVEFGAFSSGSNANCYETKTSGSYALSQNVDGLYYYSDANGLMDGDNGGIGFNYYATNSDAVAAVGGTATPKTYIELKAAQLAKEGATSIKLTINAKWKEASDKQGVHSYIALLNSANKVLAISNAMDDTASDYTFYVQPNAVLKIINGGVKGTHMYIYSIKAEASDNAVTATGSIAVESIALNTATLSGTAGGSAELTATVSPETATDVSLTWESSNPSVAKVTPAENTLSAAVEYVAAGSATITVSMGSVKQEAAVTVNAAGKPITAIAISGNAAIDLFNNDNPTTTLTATVTPADTDVTSLSWSSSDPAIATVASASTDITSGTSSVVVTAAGKVGTAKITAKAGSVEKTFDVVVSKSGAEGTYKLVLASKEEKDTWTATDEGNGIYTYTSADETVSVTGLDTKSNGSYGVVKSASATIKVAGPSRITWTGANGGTRTTFTVVAGSGDGAVRLVNGVTAAYADSEKMYFIYTGTDATTLNLSWGNGISYIKSFIVEKVEATEANVATKIEVSGSASTVVSGTPITMTASVTPKYLNTNAGNSLSGTVTWTSSVAGFASVDASSTLGEINVSTGLYKATATLTYVADGETVVSAKFGDTVSTTNATIVAENTASATERTWNAFSAISQTAVSSYLLKGSEQTAVSEIPTGGNAYDYLWLYSPGTGADSHNVYQGSIEFYGNCELRIPCAVGSTISVTATSAGNAKCGNAETSTAFASISAHVVTADELNTYDGITYYCIVGDNTADWSKFAVSSVIVSTPN